MVHTGNDFGDGLGIQSKHSVRSYTKVGSVESVGTINAP